MQGKEERLREAIELYRAQQHVEPENQASIREIAREKGVDHRTLARRVSGQSQPHQTAHKHLQALTPTEEASLVTYIARCARLGQPLTPGEVRELGNQIKRNRLLIDPLVPIDITPIGKNWPASLRKRFPEVRSSFSSNMDPQRFQMGSRQALESWFTEIRGLFQQHGYSPSNVYNMDESGYAIGVIQSTRVMDVIERRLDGRRRSSGRALQSAPARGEWVTTVECISADGRALPPLVIFKGTGSVDQQWVPDTRETQDWEFMTSESGWTSDFVGYHWLERVFEPNTTPEIASERRLLIVDGHSSHVKARFIAFCMDHLIDLCILPPHSSHLTQPLDVGVFGPLKAKMSAEVRAAGLLQAGRLPKRSWTTALSRARSAAMTGPNIRQGWKAAGLWPLDPTCVYDRLPQPSTPPQTGVSSSQSNEQSLTWESSEFMRRFEAQTATPVKQRLQILSERLEAEIAKNTLLETKLAEVQRVLGPQPTRRAGITVRNLNTHHFSTERCLQAAREQEEAAASRRRSRVASAPSPSPSRRPTPPLFTTGPLRM